jgi:hypothetical protein
MIKSGEVDIDKLSSISSKDRIAFFMKIMNERNAKEVNAIFESKLLLKNQKKGMVTWAKQITGITPEAKNTLIDKIERMSNILSPENEKDFLQSLASKRLGVDITIEEANKIAEMSKKVSELKNYTDTQGRIKYGRARMDLVDYVNKLSGKKANLVKNIIGLPRAVLATLDLSAPLNQGWGMLSRKEFYKNISTMFKSLKNEDNFLNIQAEIMTRDTFKRAKKAGLRINDLGENLELREEAFMTTLLDKVPGVSASQRAYTSFLNKLRMDVFDDLLSKAEIAGEDVGLGSKDLEDIANVVNAFTGGYGQTNALVNAALFSQRKLQSTIKMIDPRTYTDPKTSKTARKAATRNLLGSLAITATILTLAHVLGGDNIEIEEDPRSSDFGKIKTGNTRLDVSGGNASYATLISRLLTQKTKSTNTGVISKLGYGFGSPTGFDVSVNFVRNKFSPLFSLIVDSFSGENSIGEKKTIPQSVVDRFKPMFINSIYELYKDDSTGAFGKAVLTVPALFGAGLSTYSISENWQDKTSQEMTQFKASVGEEKFNEANQKYNKIISEEITALKKTDKYQALSSEDKLKEISDIKDEAKKDIFKEYNFKKKTLPKKK